MRKMNYLSMILLAVILSYVGIACNKSEEGEKVFSAQEQEVFNTLIGTWRGKGLLGNIEWIFNSSKEYTLNEYKFNTNTLTSSESGKFTLETKSDGCVYLNVSSAAYAITLINSNSIRIGGTEYNRGGSPANIDDDENGNVVVVGNAPDVSGTLNGHDYVNLGLDVMWATCNIGANSPESAGGYYAWGETDTKSTYSYANYRFYKDFKISSLFSDISGTSYDAARVRWGGSWRMPTRKEWDALGKCASKWMVYKGVKGRMFTGPNGKSLFLPAVGMYDKDVLKDFGEYGNYWSSLRGGESPSDKDHYPWAIAFDFGEKDSFGLYASSGVSRTRGLSVRAVYSTSDGSGSGNDGGSGDSSGDKPYVTSFDFTATKTSITVKFMCNERPSSATVRYGTSSPSSTTSSSISGKQVSATVSGLKSGTKYYFKCTVSNSYGSSTSDTFSAITNY